MKFFTGNELKWRLLRTIVQGILGVLIANVDLFFAGMNLPSAMKAVIVALVMAILSPVMAEIGRAQDQKGEVSDDLCE